MGANADPRVLQAICEQALALHQSGRLEDAAIQYNKVLRRNPNHADALHLLGTIRVQTGAAEVGAALIRRSIKANPTFPAAHSHLGLALWKLNRLDEALASYDRAIALRPDHAEAYNGRGLVLAALKRHEEALASHDRAIALRPNDADAHYNRGVALQALKRPDEALASQDRAIALSPDHAKAHNNRGTALCDLGRPGEALASYDRAIALGPDYAEAYANRGLALRELKRLDESLASYDAAIGLDPMNTDALLSRAMTLLLAGQFEAGWRAYESRKGDWDVSTRRRDQGAWTGETDPAGRRMFLVHEQGLGDTLQFVRYASLLKAKGADVVLSVQAPLRGLMERSLPEVTILGEDERPERFNDHCSLMSLPLAFRTTAESIPAPRRYLGADAGRRAKLEAQLAPRTKPRVGLAWSGNPTHKNDHNRSIPFAQLLPMLSVDVDWIALQNEIPPSDAPAFEAFGRVRFLGEALGDFGDTAALAELLDIVIAVDTSLAHLAGALGKPVWVLLPFIPDWRWLLDRSDSPWYPSARLFRQPEIGDWASVVDEVGGALRLL